MNFSNNTVPLTDENFDGSTIFAKTLQGTADLFCVIHQNPPPYQKNGEGGGGGGGG